MQLRINITVWGSYIGTMLEAFIPSLLAPGNLAMLHARHPIAAIDVCTLPDAIAPMRDLPLMRRLAHIAPVRFHPLERQRAPGTHQLLSAGHAVTLDVARRQQQGCVMLAPDVVLAESALAGLATLIADDTRAVLVASVRAECCGVLERLEVYRDGETLIIPPHDLMRLMLLHPHPVTYSLLINGGEVSSTWPSHLYWYVDGEGLIAHCFHMHPLYVRPDGAGIQDTIDGSYVDRLSPDGQGIVYVEHSDQVALLELSGLRHMENTVRHQPLDVALIADWTHATATPMQRQHAARPIRLYARVPTPALWATAEQHARAFLESIGL